MAILAGPVRKITGAKPASRGVNYPLLGLALVGLAFAKLGTIYIEMKNRMPTAFFGSERCTHHHGMIAPEDIVPVFEGVFITSSEERRQHMMRSIGAEAAPWGGLFAIWNVDTPGQDPKTAQLELEGFPEGTAFRPHGLHYRHQTGELFVINHAYSQGGERIDVFKVSETFPQDPLPPIHPSLLEGTPPEPSSPETPAQETGGQEGQDVFVDIGVAHAVLGSEEDGGEVAEGAAAATGAVDGFLEAAADAGEVRAVPVAGGEVVAGGGWVNVMHEEGSEKGQTGAERWGKGSGSDESAEIVPESTAENAESEPESEAESEAEAVEEVVEEIVETPKERAKRAKRETKEAVARARSDAKKVQAEERAIAKAASTRASARAKALSRGTVPVKLTYSFSVEHEAVTSNYGVLNDLVLASDDELYVTQYLAMRHPLHGPVQPDGVLELLRVQVSILLMLLQWSPAPIIHCTGIRGDDIFCERLAKGKGVMYNGIALSPDKERLLVSDTMAMQMLVFNRTLETGALEVRQRVDLSGSPDNLEIDLYRAAEGEEAYTVGLISSWDYLRYATAMEVAKDPSEGDDKKMAGGMASLVFDKESGEYKSSLEMWQDGSLLSISSAASTASGSRLLGSAVEEGFLLCRPPPCSPGSETSEGCNAWSRTPTASVESG